MAGKWDEVDRRIRSNTADNSLPPTEALVPELVPPTSLTDVSTLSASTPEPGNIVDRYRARQIDRRVARAYWEQYYDAKLELVRHELKEAVRAKSAEMTAKVERVLMQLNDAHLQFLAELGLKNIAQRQKILIQLQEQTSRQMQEVLNRDWPQALKNQTIDQLLAMSKSFAEKLHRELGVETS